MILKFLIIYLVAINLIAFVVYGVDKRAAIKGRFRVRVATLLGLAFIGGSVGALLGMYLFRHKTKKPQFTIGVPLMLALHLVAVWYLIQVI